jgi:hypothetical protein
MRTSMTILLALGTLLALGAAHATEKGTLGALDREVMNTPVFLKHHPDVRWRFEGLEALEAGDRKIAFRHFVRAARYGDKMSQAMVAEMHWLGIGTRADRPLGYAWMDLAAERLYEPLLVKREIYWRSLSAAAQARALEVGRAVYDEYGDDVALPRLKQLLDRGRRSMTGSRVGSQVGTQTIYPGSGASIVTVAANSGFAGPFESRQGLGFSISGDGNRVLRHWDPRFWDMRRYLAWKEAELDFDLSIRSGTVEVRPIKVDDR